MLLRKHLILNQNFKCNFINMLVEIVHPGLIKDHIYRDLENNLDNYLIDRDRKRIVLDNHNKNRRIFIKEKCHSSS